MTSTMLRVLLKGEGRTSTPVSEQVLPKFLGRLGIDGRITHGQVVQGAVLVGRAGIVRQLHDPVEQFLGRRAELRGRGLLRLRDGLDERVAIEGIDLVECDDGHHQSIAHLRRGDRSAQCR